MPDAFALVRAGPRLRLHAGALEVELAPRAGGRIAQIRFGTVEHLIAPSGDDAAPMIAWGCYPMVPWAGRIRRGRFVFEGREWSLPLNMAPHAIHGVGFALPWHVEAKSAAYAALSLTLPEDARWPFGGSTRQEVRLSPHSLQLSLSVRAGRHAMPAAIGWHPWFRKPERMRFSPIAMYPRDHEGIAVSTIGAPASPPWDDCFINEQPIVIERDGQHLRLSSSCRHWVVYDGAQHATCIEPQTGPPDAFNLSPCVLSPGDELRADFRIEWLDTCDRTR